MFGGLLAALAAACAFGTASVLQTVGARRAGPPTPMGSVAVGPRLARALLAQPLFATGVVLDVVAFVLNLVALGRLPLFLVQPVIGSAVGVTAVLASVFLGEQLGPRRRRALLGTAGGLTLVALSASAGEASTSRRAGWLLLTVGLPLLAGLAVVVNRRARAAAGIALSALSGLAFAGFGIAGRTLVPPESPWAALTSPGVWAATGFAAGGLVLFGAALQHSPVTTVTGVSMMVEGLLPASLGLLLWDHARPGYGLAVALGLALSLFCTVVLARPESPEPDPESFEPEPSPTTSSVTLTA